MNSMKILNIDIAPEILIGIAGFTVFFFLFMSILLPFVIIEISGELKKIRELLEKRSKRED